ncbi:hypothetical protein H0H93_003656 [Arthromyces matolae]|nr:hypothetical protein H0H93_003656 [Arthromyces matolae]
MVTPLSTALQYLVTHISLHTALFGGLSVQVYFYFLSFPDDTLVLKGLGTRYSPTLDSSNIFLPPIGSPQLSLCHRYAVALLVQYFFAWRIWVLSSEPHSYLKVCIIGIILLTGLASFILSIAFGVTWNTFIHTSEDNFSAATSMIGFMTTSIVCDGLIMITFVTQLQLNMKDRYLFSDIRNILHHATRMALETGTLTCMMAVVQLIIYFNGDIYYLILGKIYSNSLLASLNSRATIFKSSVHVASEEEFAHDSLVFARPASIRDISQVASA